MDRDDKTIKPPSFALLAAEGRAMLDIPALHHPYWPWLSRAGSVGDSRSSRSTTGNVEAVSGRSDVGIMVSSPRADLAKMNQTLFGSGRHKVGRHSDP